jgi:outer membrane protein OmpA-like peptidoglycan-associated protein
MNFFNPIRNIALRFLNYSSILLFFLVIQSQGYSQGKKVKIGIGDEINEVVFAKGSDNLTYELPLKINMSGKSLIVLYRFNNSNNLMDSADSLRYVENITSYLGKILKNDNVYLRPYVISKNKDKLSKLTFSYHYAHSLMTKKSSLSNITSNSLFSIYDTISNPNSFVKSDKLIITNNKGKVLAMSPSLAGFKYNGKNMNDIFEFMSKVKNPEPTNNLDSSKNEIKLIPPATIPITIKGKLISQLNTNNTPLKMAYVTVLETNPKNVTDTVARTKTDYRGIFTLVLPNEKGNYRLNVVSANKNEGSMLLTNKSGFEIAKLEKINETFDYILIPADITKMQDILNEDLYSSFDQFKNSKHTDLNVTENISYSSGKFEVENSSMLILDEVYKILQSNPSIKLEVISHTDALGDENENLQLSVKRANSVINYLVKKGIESNRLKAIGKGEGEILNRCKNGVNCSDEEHAYNRRTEFHFMK